MKSSENASPAHGYSRKIKFPSLITVAHYSVAGAQVEDDAQNLKVQVSIPYLRFLGGIKQLTGCFLLAADGGDRNAESPLVS